MFLLKAELLPDQITQAVLDLAVSGEGRFPAVGGIGVDVMTAPMPVQDAALLDQLPDEIASLQTSTSISFTRVSVWPGPGWSSIKS